MKKLYVLLTALFAFSAVVNAGVKNLYKQDFEMASTPADAGWTSPNLAGGMSLTSEEYGKWFTFSLGGNNNRNAVLNFNYGLGADETIFGAKDQKEYTVKFQWGFVKNTNNGGDANQNKNLQFSSEVALLSEPLTANDVPEGWKITSVINNGQYAGKDSLFLFSLTQLKGAWQAADDTKTPPVEQTPYWNDVDDISSLATTFYLNGNTDNRIELQEGMWYDITVTVNTEARTANYEIVDIEGTPVTSGTYNLPSYTKVWAKGINVLLGRYNAVESIDEVKVQVPTEGDYANAPSISLTEIYMAQRTFDIYFEEGEILHIKKTEGDEDTAVESPYRYVTSTSGTLEVWTEAGTATSEHVTYNVEAGIISLPAATVDITKVNAGYVKTLLMTVDNSKVPTQPNITLTWEYSNGDNSGKEVASGAKYEATEKGTLTVTTHAYGFQETTTKFENNTEFAVDKSIDFQHMEEATLIEKGFTEIDPLQADKMSGEQNWTARKRLWFGIENGEVDADQNPKYDTYVVYGPAAASEVVEPIRRFYLKPSTLTQQVATTIFAPFYTWYTGQADPAVADGSDVAGLKMNYGIGLINTGTKTDDGTSINYANGVVGIDGLTDNDYFILYVVSDYGNSSKHPVYPQGTKPAEGKELYKAENIGDGTNVQVKRGTETFSLYRIDTAIARVDIFKAVNASGIDELNYNKIVSDHNAPIYNLNGVQMNPNALQKGLYIKQGKKFVIK